MLSKIFNDFSKMNRLRNSRLLAAFLLYNNISDFSILQGSEHEANTLFGILTNDSAACLNNRIVIGDDFYENIFQIENLMDQLTQAVKSRYLVEYFWFKVSRGEFESVKDIKSSNIEV